MTWLLFLSLAWSGEPASTAREAILQGDPRTARKAIAELDAAIAATTTPVDAHLLGQRYQLEAALADLLARESDMLDAMRQAWVVAPNSQPDPEILTRAALADVFRAIGPEVSQRPAIDLASLGLPLSPVRIDGRAREDEPFVSGRHLVQVECADGSWSTTWSTLQRRADWGHTCPDGALAAAPLPPEGTPTDDAPPDAPSDEGFFARYWPPPMPSFGPGPNGRRVLGGPMLGMGTGGELLVVPGGDAGGFITTASLNYFPLRIAAGEIGLGWQSAGNTPLGVEVRGGIARWHETLVYTDELLYISSALLLRYDPPGTGWVAHAGVGGVLNYVDQWLVPRASIGYQF